MRTKQISLAVVQDKLTLSSVLFLFFSAIVCPDRSIPVASTSTYLLGFGAQLNARPEKVSPGSLFLCT